MAALRTSSFTSGRLIERGRAELRSGQEVKASHTVLVVEDEVLVRMLIADKLRNVGYQVVEASDAEEALDVLAHRFDVKLVLSDIQMPGSMDGVALAHVVRSRYPAMKILLTSGHDAAINEAEHDGFFAKPYVVEKIIDHIQTLLD
jgi:two-component system, response regulator PdtaR